MIHRYIIEVTDEVKGFEKAIERLDREWGIEEQEPCEDAISREAVLNLFNKSDEYRWETTWIRHKIEELPSVTPKFTDAEIQKMQELEQAQLDKAYELGAEQTNWIPVSERLPDTDDEVLCWYEYYHWSRGKVLPEYGLGYYLGSTSTWGGEVANGRNVRVIAWMPIQPYKAEGSDEE